MRGLAVVLVLVAIVGVVTGGGADLPWLPLSGSAETESESQWLLWRSLAAGLVLASVCAGLLASASAARADGLSFGQGGKPDVAVEPDGTADFVWNGPETLSPTVRFCRIPRGSTSCAQSATLSPGGGTVTRPQVFVSGSTVRIVTFRYGLPTSRDLLYTSTDGGAHFGGPEEIGSLSPGEIAQYSAGGVTRFAAITAAVSPAQVQVMAPGAGVPASSASLGTTYIYSGGIGAAGSTLVAVSTSSDETTIGYSTSSAGDPNASGSWSAFQPVTSGLVGRLASGPAGLFLMVGSGTAGQGVPRLSVRPWTGSGFGSPVPVPGTANADVPSASMTEDPGGLLHVFWHDATGVLSVSTSADHGSSWSAAEVLVTGQATYDDLRTAAAGDHGGAAVWTAGGLVFASFIAPPAAPAPAGGGAPPGTTYVPARASLTLRAGGVAGKRPLVLDASASRVPGSVVSAYRWDVNGDGRTDVSCGGNASTLEVPIAKSGSATASVSVVDSGGAVTTAAVPFTVGVRTSRAARLAAGLALPASQAYICRSGAAAAATTTGGPPASCTNHAEVTYGVVDAVGCFTAVDSAHPVPGREQDLIFSDVLHITGTAPKSTGRLSALSPAQQQATTKIAGQDTQVSTQPIIVNGLTVTPANGAALVLLPSTRYLVSSNATVRAGPIVLQTGKLVASLPYAKNGVKLTGFDLTRPQALPGLALPLFGHVDVVLKPDGTTDLPVHLGLPSVFRDPISGKGLTGDATLHADNANGLGTIAALHVSAPDVWLGGVELQNMFFDYSAATGQENGGGEVVFPPSGDRIHGELGFVRGAFNRLYLAWSAGAGTGISVGPGAFITRIGAGFSLNPTELDGDVTTAAGTSIGGGCPAVGVAGHLHMHFAPGPVSLDATGTGQVVCIPLADIFFHVDGGGYVTFGGGLNLDFGPFSIDANVAAQFLNPHFQFDGDAHGCVTGLGCIGGEAVLSDRGVGFCADFGFVHAGGGVHFSGTVPNLLSILAHTTLMADSCDIAQFRSLPKAAGAAQSAAPRTLTVPRGERVAVIAVRANGTPPSLSLSGPGGRTLHSAPPNAPVRNAHEVIFTSPNTKTAYFLLNHPAPGRWTVTPDAGSAAITDVQTSHSLPAPQLHGTVTGKGASRILRYRITPLAGQQIRFVEQAGKAAQDLGVAQGAQGTLRFQPLDDPTTTRRILALVTQDGRPRTTVTVTHYRGAPVSLTAPGHVRVTRRSRRILVSWSPVSGAERYRVSARLTDGRALILSPTGHRHTITIPNVAQTTTGTLRIVAYRGLSHRSPATTAALKRR